SSPAPERAPPPSPDTFAGRRGTPVTGPRRAGRRTRSCRARCGLPAVDGLQGAELLSLGRDDRERRVHVAPNLRRGPLAQSIGARVQRGAQQLRTLQTYTAAREVTDHRELGSDGVHTGQRAQPDPGGVDRLPGVGGVSLEGISLDLDPGQLEVGDVALLDAET